jgi:hypothetical protein
MMTMHLVKPYLTTTRYNGKQKKSNSKRLQQAQAEHAAWLKSKGIKDTKSDYRHEIPDYSTGPRVTSDTVCSHGPAKDRKEYSGERQLIGIATMHKSNMVPVFADNKQAAIDIARMRR